MLKATLHIAAITLTVYITHPLAVQSGYPSGLLLGAAYVVGIYGIFDILGKR